MPSSSDQALARKDERVVVLLAIAGDDAAFEELVLRHQAHIRSLLRRISGNAALADDLAQATFLRAWQNLRTLRDPGTFAAWLRRIAVNIAIDGTRRAGASMESLDADEATAAAIRDRTDERIDLEAALNRLSVAARTCVLLFHSENLSHAEIAAEIGMPLGTVKSHIARATTLLREWLGAWRQIDD